MTYEEWTTYQLKQVEEVLAMPGDLEERVVIRDFLKTFRGTLLRLRQAERFCVAAKALAEYKKPLETVLDSLDAWERMAISVQHPEAGRAQDVI